MAEQKMTQFDVGKIIEEFFDDSSIPLDGKEPKFVLVMGMVGAGKSTRRKQNYSTGYVVIDAGEIYAILIKETYQEFEDYKNIVETLGRLIASRAVKGKRNIVMEMIGHREEDVKVVMDAMLSAGYKIDVQFVYCDPQQAYERHLKAVEEDRAYISNYFTHESHRQWLLEAAEDLRNSDI